MEKVVEIYRRLCQFPNVVGARIYSKGNSNSVIYTVWSQRNLETELKTTFSKCFLVDNQLKSSIDICTFDTTKEFLSARSDSAALRAVVYDKGQNTETKQILEIWRDQNMMRSVDLGALDVHGNIYNDGEFGSFNFSPSEKKLIYIAEKKRPKTEPFYKRKSPTAEKGDANENSKVVKGDEYKYRQDWGEQLVGKVQTVICLYDIESDQVSTIENFPEDFCPAQVLFSQDEKDIIGIAYKTVPRKLGLCFCTNRVNQLFIYNIQSGSYRAVSASEKSARSPRISPKGDCVVWLERTIGGTHHSCMTLMKMKLPYSAEIKPELVIDVVEVSTVTSNGKPFYGIYSTQLPSRCFSNDGKYVFLSTSQQNRVVSYAINIDTNDVIELNHPENSLSILDVFNDNIIAVTTNFKSVDKIIATKVSSVLQNGQINWLEVSKPMEVVDELKNFTYADLQHKHNNSDEVSEFTSIYFGPETGKEKSVPLIVYIHGGPNANFVHQYLLSASLHACLGFATLFVNFRGSAGAGQKTINFLPTRVGDADVKDCVLATEDCLKLYSQLDPSRVAVMGGSHGGFLSTHLSGQYPEMYRAVVVRNPVTDIASMYMISDIPDWCTVQTEAFNYTQVGPISESMMIAQRKASPVVHAHKVKAPTLLLVGSEDLRVPPSQSIEFYHRLKANGVNVKMNVYKDNHSLSKIPVEFDSTVHAMLWLLENTV